MKLKPIATQILLKKAVKQITENVVGDAKDVQNKMFALGNELKADGEDVSDEEVQAAMLNALVAADGKISNVDVSDVDAIKNDIKESKGYVISEASELMHAVELAGTVLGNAALLHAIAGGLAKLGIKVDEESLKQKITKVVGFIKKVTGFPAKAMERAFTWIAKKLGFSQFGQKIAGLSGTLLITIAFLALAIYMFPSISSGVLLMFAISGMVGKGVEIGHILKEMWQHIKDEMESSPEKLASNT
jgi:hypothetical protein